jgi:hypothetical protein
LTFADGTSVALGAESQIGPISEADGVLASKGKRVTILRGTLEATVAKQPPEEPMIFLTPQGQIRVLGTSLRVRVDPGPGGQTRLEVEEGLVRFVRTSDGRSAQVGTGMTLSVGNSGGSLVVVPRTNDDILLHARDATLVGNDWGVVRDEKATTGWALDSPRGTMRQDSVARSTSFVSFTFPVDEGKDYFVWVRGACLWRSNQRLQHDAVALVTLDGRFSKTNLARPGDATCYLFNGWGEGQGEREATYFWLGGENASDSVTLRFPRSGLATVTLHSMEGPMRIDALWISTSQKTLPEANVPGPPGTRK